MPETFQQLKAIKKTISRVLMTIIFCIMMLGTHRALPTCYQYPRYLGSYASSNYILSMDMHFSTDLLVYVGSSSDSNLNRNTLCSWCEIPVVVAMSISQPTFKWTLSAVQWSSQSFTDVDISDDGAKVLVAGSGTDALNKVILWVLSTDNGSIISQKVVKVLDSDTAPYPLTSRLDKQALLSSSQPLIYLLLRTNSPDTTIYLAKLDYSATDVTTLWSLQTDPNKTTQSYSQITFGGSSVSTLETILYVVVPIGSKYKVSRIAEDGAIQWTQEFPMNTAYNKQVFIEFGLNSLSGGDNMLVIANAQFNISILKISSTESQAAVGPVHSSRKLFKEQNQYGAISAIYVKPSSDIVYLLRKYGSYYYIGHFSTSALTITYKQAFQNCNYDKGYSPRGIFRDETNYFAALNCQYNFDYYERYSYSQYNSSCSCTRYYTTYYQYQIGTYYYGGQIFASSKSQYTSCYYIPSSSSSSNTMTDQTASLNVVTPSSGPWQMTAAPVVIEVANDSKNDVKSLSMMYLTQNEGSCSVYSYKGVSQQASTPFINYVSGVSREFNVLFSASQICLSGTTTASPSLSYSLENAQNSGSLDPTSFMTINPSNGTISISNLSLSSNFNYKVRAKASGIPNGIIISQDYMLYDLRLYFADLKNATMLSGETMRNRSTLHSQTSNPLTIGSIKINSTSLRSPPYFIQHDSYNKVLIVAPIDISHFGVHTLSFKVSDPTGCFYEHVVQVNVRNRAPYFSNNITNTNYSAIFNTITTFALPTRVSPDLGSPWVRVISTHSFVTIVGQGRDILMRVHALDFYNDITVHNVSLELYIPNYPNTTKYWVNLKILNNPPRFDMPLADYDMGLYWNKNYKLPKVIDPDGDSPVSVRWGIVTIFDFIKFEPSTNTFTFNPMEVEMIGDYSIMVTLTDHHMGTYSEEFTVRVHRPPMFAVDLKKFFSMKVGSVFEFELPLFETDGIDITHSSLPGFAIIDKFQYTFKPATIPHLGVFMIKGKLQNQWGSLNFDFRIEVTNEPPSLAMTPKDLIILQDTIFTQSLPLARDPEDQPISIKMSEAGQKSLPSFLTFNPITKEIMLAPTKKTKIGIFMIQVDVYDSMNYFKTYKFLIQVLENTFANKELKKNNEGKIRYQIMQKNPSQNFQRYQAKLIIQQVTRNGRATLKLAAGAGKTGQLAIQVTNDTFQIKLNRGEKVRYEVGNVIEERGIVEIQLFFANPSNISNKIEPDKIEVQVVQYLQFENFQMIVELKEGQKDQKYLPPQMTSGSKVLSYFSSGSIELSNSTAKNFVVSMALQNIWIQLDDMSFMSINSMISMPVPGMVQLFNKIIMTFIYVDIFLSDKWMPELFYGFERVNDDNEPLNSYFDESGYSSTMLLKNINSSLVFLLVYCSLYGFLIILRILGACSQRIMMAYEKMRKKLFWSISIKFFDNQYPPLLSASLINLFDLRFDNKIHTASSVMSLAILFASAVSIVSMIYHLNKARKNEKLRSEDFRSRLGALTQGQRMISFPGVYWRALVLLRWTATMLIMTLLRHNFYLQIFPLLAISFLFQAMIIGSNPMQSKLENNMMLFNEIMVSVYLYLLLCLTDFMEENNSRDFIGLLLLSLVGITVLINLVKFLIVCDWCFLIRKIKKKFSRQKKYAMDREAAKLSLDVDLALKEFQTSDQKQRKRNQKKAGPPNHKTNSHNEDQTKKGESSSVADEYGGGFCDYLDQGEEIKQADRQQELKHKNKRDLLVMESYNQEKESQENPFRDHKERVKLEEEVQQMMWEFRDLAIKGKKINTEENELNKE